MQIQACGSHDKPRLESEDLQPKTKSQGTRQSIPAIELLPIETNTKTRQDLGTATSPEPMVIGEDHTCLEIGNFTGFSNILDSSYNLNDISTINSGEYENQEGKVELFEVIHGELTHVTPDLLNSSSNTEMPISITQLMQQKLQFRLLLQKCK